MANILRAGLRRCKQLLPKRRHNRAAISRRSEAAIRRLRADGLTLREIALEVGCCEQTVRRWLRRPPRPPSSVAREQRRLIREARLEAEHAPIPQEA